MLKIVLIIIVILILLIAVFMTVVRKDGEKMYEKYAQFSAGMLEKNFSLSPFPIKAEFQHVVFPKGLGLFDFLVTSFQSDRLSRINSLNATMFKMMKMYTLMIRPADGYNLPVLSVDFIFMPFGKRVFVIEVIDPARIEDANKNQYYAKMREAAGQVSGFEQSGVRDWYKQYIEDFSIHIKADKTNDELLFATYKTFLAAYIDMAKNAQQLQPQESERVKDGFEQYVSTLLAQGGPAVDVFKKILGPEGQKEYIRTVMFGLDK